MILLDTTVPLCLTFTYYCSTTSLFPSCWWLRLSFIMQSFYPLSSFHSFSLIPFARLSVRYLLVNNPGGGFERESAQSEVLQMIFAFFLNLHAIGERKREGTRPVQQQTLLTANILSSSFLSTPIFNQGNENCKKVRLLLFTNVPTSRSEELELLKCKKILALGILLASYKFIYW